MADLCAGLPAVKEAKEKPRLLLCAWMMWCPPTQKLPGKERQWFFGILCIFCMLSSIVFYFV